MKKKLMPCDKCEYQYENPNRCYYCRKVYYEMGVATEYKPKIKSPSPFYVVEHEGQHNPITKSFENIKEAETYFNKNLSCSPILYEVFPIAWVDRNGTKHETYN